MELTLIILIVYIGYREYLWYRERSSMLDRLMSRSFEEYKDNSKPEPNKLESKPKLEPLEAHREDIEKWQR